jgi:hypothetical protein
MSCDDPPVSTSRSENPFRERRPPWRECENVEKTARVLARLDVVTLPDQLRLPGFGLHWLEGDLAGYWTIVIRGD